MIWFAVLVLCIQNECHSVKGPSFTTEAACLAYRDERQKTRHALLDDVVLVCARQSAFP